MYVADRVANLGANVYIVHRFGIITSEDAWIKAQKRPLVTMEEYERLRDNHEGRERRGCRRRPQRPGPQRQTSPWKVPG